MLSVLPEKRTVKPGEIFYVPIEFTDKNGIIKPYIEQPVEISAENAALLGFGSALIKTDEVFNKTMHMTYRGRALAVFRAEKAGQIKIRAKSKGFADAEAIVEVTE